MKLMVENTKESLTCVAIIGQTSDFQVEARNQEVSLVAFPLLTTRGWPQKRVNLHVKIFNFAAEKKFFPSDQRCVGTQSVVL